MNNYFKGGEHNHYYGLTQSERSRLEKALDSTTAETKKAVYEIIKNIKKRLITNIVFKGGTIETVNIYNYDSE